MPTDPRFLYRALPAVAPPTVQNRHRCDSFPPHRNLATATITNQHQQPDNPKHKTMRLSKLHALSFSTSVLFALLAGVNAQGQVPRYISYQGIALADDKTPVPNGDHPVSLVLYASESGGSPIYTQGGTVTTTDGYFTLLIGPLPSTLTFDRPYWLGLALDGQQEGTPRTQFTASPYALGAVRAGTADSALYAGRLVEGAPGVVTSVNGIAGAISVTGTGGTTVTANGNTLTIHSDQGTGGGNSGWQLAGNVGTVEGENFVGTLDNRPFEIHVNESGYTDESTSGRGRVFRFEGTDNSPNLLGGYHSNIRGEHIVGATIAGGGAFGAVNAVGANYGSVGGGKGNKASGENATVSGGMSNTASGLSATVGGGTSNTAESNTSTVAGGLRNRAKDWNATVSGGKDNTAEGLSAVIAGGEQNAATGMGVVIGGGIGNLVFGNYGTLSGGESNATSREHSTVGGGRYNNASALGSVVAGGVSDTASGNYSAVGGGLANRAQGLYAFTGGGEVNHADGRAAAVAGGSLNNAEGDYSAIIGGQGLTLKGHRSFGFLANSPAADRKMTINASNVGVFGNVDLWIVNNDTTARQIRFYAPNPVAGAFPGVGANYSSFQAGNQGTNIEYILPVQPGSVGDMLAVSAVNGSKISLTWNGITSDRGRKENFLAIDPEGVLEKFRALDLGTWNYRGEGARHYGVMAQDFSAAFGRDELGVIGTDTTLQVVDLAGVAYLAIQGLEKRTQELKETQSALMEAIEELKRARAEQEELKARIEELEEKMGG